MSFIDCAVLAVPTANRDAYLDMTKIMAGIFKENGALSVLDCWEAEVPDGEVTSFRMAVKAEAGESIVVSWIVWPDKATRDAGMGAAMQDPRAADLKPPFDGKRMIFGGFEELHRV